MFGSFVLVAALDVSVFFSVSLLQVFEVVQVSLSSFDLVVRVLDFSIHFLQLLVFLLQLVVFLIDLTLQVVNFVQIFGNIVLELTDVALLVGSFTALVVILAL